MILADDADGRSDLVPLLESLAERHEEPAVRVVLVTRSAGGLRAALAGRAGGAARVVVSGSAELDRAGAARRTRSAGSVRQWPRSPPRWASRPPVLPERFPARRLGEAEPFVMLQGQALLAVLHRGR